MPTITTKDGTQIFYKDWGSGQPVVFSHGWPLNADARESQMFFLASRGYRCIAHDRRGHGRSSQPWNGNDMDTYADDLATLVEALDLKNAIHVGHSTGGGEVARYTGRHGAKRVAKAVLMAGHKNAFDCIKAFSETDFTEDLKKIDVPTLILHGDDDQIVPIADSALLSSKLVKNAVLKIYPGGAHSLGDTSKDQVNAELFAFFKV